MYSYPGNAAKFFSVNSHSENGVHFEWCHPESNGMNHHLKPLRLGIACVGIFSICVLAGCQHFYTIHFSGIVTDSSTGMPLQDVAIMLDEVSSQLGAMSFPVLTNADGTFSFQMKVSGGKFDSSILPDSILNCSKAGFLDKSVKLGRIPRPTGGKEVYIVVAIDMREKVAGK